VTAEFTFDYDSRFQPAMPAVDVRVGPALGAASLELAAIVDSGADATSIPVGYLQQISARRNRRAWLRGVTGDPLLVDLYAVALELGPLRQGLLEVIGDRLGDEVIIGRDVLNDLLVILNGPAHTVQVRE
jgi:hypothetical protein